MREKGRTKSTSKITLMYSNIQETAACRTSSHIFNFFTTSMQCIFIDSNEIIIGKPTFSVPGETY